MVVDHVLDHSEGKETPPVLRDGAAPELRREVDELVERFLVEADIAESTQEGYRKALRQFFQWREADGAGGITRGDIVRYKRGQLSRLQPGTVGSYISALKSFFKWLEAEKLYPNVAAGVKGTKASRGHKKDALTPDQIAHVLEVLKGEGVATMRDFAIVNLLIKTGLRTVELARANVGDIRTKGAQSVLYVQGKGRQDKDEFVVLTPATVRPIYTYLALRESRSKDEPLFASLSNKSYGKRLTTRSLRRIAKDALRKAGFDDPRLTAHSMRHSAITLALLGGASLQQAQALARHSNINTTLIYSHNIDRVNNAAEFAIEDLLKDL